MLGDKNNNNNNKFGRNRGIPKAQKVLVSTNINYKKKYSDGKLSLNCIQRINFSVLSGLMSNN